MTTDKQRNVLLNAGWTDAQINATSYEDVSAAIGEIMANKAPNPYKKVVKSPAVVSEFKPKKAWDSSSYYVAYAKDLCVAMLQANVEATKIIHPKEQEDFQMVEIATLMNQAISCIKAAKKEFEA